MIRFEIDEKNSLKMSHAKYFELNMNIISTFNSSLRELYMVLHDNANTREMAERHDDNSDYYIPFVELYDRVKNILFFNIPICIGRYLLDVTITPELAQDLLILFEENYTEKIIADNSKELFKKLCSLLEESVKLDKNIKKIEDD